MWSHGKFMAGWLLLFFASQCQLKPKCLNKIQISQSAVPSTAHMKRPNFGNKTGSVISIEYSDKISLMKCSWRLLKKRNENKALVCPPLKKKKRQLYLDSHGSLIIDFITTNEKQKDYKEVKSQWKHNKKSGKRVEECREIV